MDPYCCCLPPRLWLRVPFWAFPAPRCCPIWGMEAPYLKEKKKDLKRVEQFKSAGENTLMAAVDAARHSGNAWTLFQTLSKIILSLFGCQHGSKRGALTPPTTWLLLLLCFAVVVRLGFSWRQQRYIVCIKFFSPPIPHYQEAHTINLLEGCFLCHSEAEVETQAC